MEQKEHVRFIPLEDCGLQVREVAGQESGRRVEGRPIIFGVRSVNLTPWSESRVVYEVLEPGCISLDLLQRSDVILNINHSTKVTDILGRYRKGKGSLQLALQGSHVEASCDLPKTNCANDTLELIKRGDISGMSFAFKDDYQDTENGVSYERTNEKTIDGKEVWIRHVKKITELHDVAIVTNPAYEQTSVVTREAGDKMLQHIDDIVGAEQQRQADEAAAKEAEEAAKREAEAQATKEAEEQAAREDAAAKEAEAKAKAKEEQEQEQRDQQRMVARAHLLRQKEEESLFIN